MVHMTQAYLTKKQMPQTLWFYAITHAARMMNAIPGKLFCHFASPFLLVHGVGHDKQMLILLFFVCYFYHEWDGDQQCSKHQTHTMDGIVIGCSPSSNALSTIHATNNTMSRTVTALTLIAFQDHFISTSSTMVVSSVN
jgi:hypothetical protein